MTETPSQLAVVTGMLRNILKAIYIKGLISELVLMNQPVQPF